MNSGESKEHEGMKGKVSSSIVSIDDHSLIQNSKRRLSVDLILSLLCWKRSTNDITMSPGSFLAVTLMKHEWFASLNPGCIITRVTSRPTTFKRFIVTSYMNALIAC